MKRAIFLYVTLILILNVFSISCGKKSDDARELEMYKDILEDYEIMEKIEPTSKIDFTSNQSRKFLLNGWSNLEKTHTWAEGKSSTLFFYSFDNSNDKNAVITCAPIYSDKSAPQEINIFLNGSIVTSRLLDNKLQSYRIKLPKSQLKLGKNILTFEYEYTINPAGPDERDLSVMFKSTIFGNYEHKPKDHFRYEKSKGILLQYPNSIINYYLSLVDNTRLALSYEVEGKLRSCVDITLDSGQMQKVDLPAEKSKVFQDLPSKKGGMVKISLVALSDDKNSRVTWKSLKVYRARKNNGFPDNCSGKKDELQKTVLEDDGKPNILVYVVDALRSDHLFCYGYSKETSPYLDHFAKNNSLFLNAYANSSWTKASAASLLTGLLPKNHKTMARNSSLPADLQTLPEILRSNGYYTAAFITNDNISGFFSFDQGFDEFIFLPADARKKSVHVLSDELNRYVFAFFDRFFQRQNRKPLFALIWSMDPHNPYTPDRSVSQEFEIDRYEPVDARFGLLSKLREGSWFPSESELQYIKTLYDQEIFFNDKSFGSLLKEMRQRGIYEDSTIIFTADHG